MFLRARFVVLSRECVNENRDPRVLEITGFLTSKADAKVAVPVTRASQRSAYSRAIDRAPVGLSRAGILVWRIIAHGTTPVHPHGILFFWPRWERLAHRLAPTTQIPDAPYGLLHVRRKVYKGRPVQCSNGFVLRRRAVIAELHCDNPRLLHMVMSHRLNPYAACREDLHSLAAWVRNDPSAAPFEAIYGYTMLRSAAARLGFTIRASADEMRRHFDRFFMIGLLLMYTNLGLNRLTHGKAIAAYPARVIMSRDRLLTLYGDRSGYPLDVDAEQREI